MIDGRKVRLNGIDFFFRPLRPEALRKLYPLVEKKLTGDLSGKFEAVVILAFFSLRQNYPKITFEEVENLIDLQNVKDVVEAVTDPSAIIVERVAARHLASMN